MMNKSGQGGIADTLTRHMMPCSISQIGSNHLYRKIYRQDSDLVYQRYVLFLEEGCRL